MSLELFHSLFGPSRGPAAEPWANYETTCLGDDHSDQEARVTMIVGPQKPSMTGAC